MTELLKKLLCLIIKLSKYILSKLNRFVKEIRLLLLKFGKWILRPKVRNSILGILAFCIPFGIDRYDYYSPDISISYSEPLKSDDIFSSKFTIENNGNCDIYDVIFNFKFVKSDYTNKRGHKITMHDNTVTSSKVDFGNIKSNRNQSIPQNLLRDRIFTYGIGLPYKNVISTNVKLEIYLTYKYWFFPIKQVKNDTFKFISSENINGKTIWLSNQ